MVSNSAVNCSADQASHNRCSAGSVTPGVAAGSQEPVPVGGAVSAPTAPPLGYVRPVLGYVRPALGYVRPALGYVRPALGYVRP